LFLTLFVSLRKTLEKSDEEQLGQLGQRGKRFSLAKALVDSGVSADSVFKSSERLENNTHTTSFVNPPIPLWMLGYSPQNLARISKRCPG
jgi:hypothetical protein